MFCDGYWLHTNLPRMIVYIFISMPVNNTRKRSRVYGVHQRHLPTAAHAAKLLNHKLGDLYSVYGNCCPDSTHWHLLERQRNRVYRSLPLCYYLRSVLLVKHGCTVDSSLCRSQNAAQFPRSNDTTSHFDLHNDYMDLRCSFFAFAIGGLAQHEIPGLSPRLGLFPTQCGYLHGGIFKSIRTHTARTIHGKHSVEKPHVKRKIHHTDYAHDSLLVFLSFRFPFLLVDLIMVQCIECRTFGFHDDDRIVSHDAIFYVHNATSTLSVISS